MTAEEYRNQIIIQALGQKDLIILNLTTENSILKTELEKYRIKEQETESVEPVD